MARKVNLVIDAGSAFSKSLDIVDANGNPYVMTGFTCNSQFRKTSGSNSAVTFTTAISNTSITLSLTANQTSNVEAGLYYYDIKVTDLANNVHRVLEGLVTLTPMITT